MRFSLREVVFVILLMGIPIGAWWFVFRPRSARDAEMLKQIEAKRTKLSAVNYATASVGNLKKEISDLTKGIEFFQSKLPSEKEIDKVLQEVWKLAESNQLTTKRIHTLRRTSDSGFVTSSSPHAEQPIAMEFQGDFIGLYGFLLALERQPRIMRIRKLTVSQLADGPDGYVQADFDMSIFFEKAMAEE